MVIGKLLNSYKWKICYQLSWLVHRGRYLNRKVTENAGFVSIVAIFAICGLVVPVLQDWRTLALACVSPWRVGGGALQASGLQLHPSTLAMYLFYTLLAQTYTILQYLIQFCVINQHMHCTSTMYFFFVLLIHSAWIVHQAFSRRKIFCGQCFFCYGGNEAMFILKMFNISQWKIFPCLVFLLLPCWQCVVS